MGLRGTIAIGIFTKLARWSADLLGTWQAFIIAVAAIVVWLVSGPTFGHSDTW